MLTFEEVGAKNSYIYEKMTFSSYIPKLKSNKSTVGIGAKISTLPVGLILIEKQNVSAKILSIFVEEKYRNIGIGSELLKEASKRLKRKKINSMEVEFCSNLKEVKAIFKLFLKAGWKGPIKTSIAARCSKELEASKYLQTNVVFPKNFKVVKWSKLEKSEEEELAKIRSPKYLNPLENRDKVFAKGSFILKKDEEVVGWIISYDHFVGADAVDFGKLFIVPKLRDEGLGFQLLLLSLQHYLKIEGESRPGFFKINLTNRVMMKIYEKMLKPYLLSEDLMLKFSTKF